MDPYIDGAGIVHEDYWFPIVMERSTVRGKQYGVPRDVGWAVWSYNIDLFDAKGVAHPEVGWTMDDFVEAAVALTDEDAGIWGCEFTGPAPLLLSACGYIKNLGFKMFSEDGRQVAGVLDSPESMRCIQHVLDLEIELKVGPTMADAEVYESPWLAYQAGLMGIGQGGSYEFDIQLAQPFEWDFCEPPVSEWGGYGRWTYADAVPWAMWSGGKHKAETWEFLKFCSGPEGTRIPHRIGSWASPCPAVWEELKEEVDPRYQWLMGQAELPSGKWDFRDFRFLGECVFGPYIEIWTRYVERGERPLEPIVHEQAELAQQCLDSRWGVG
jgi:multiple sugar transport system substrate-binding protein